MRASVYAICFALALSPATAAERKNESKNDVPECRTADWYPPWNREHCKDHEGMWVNGKCVNPRWMIIECKIP